MVHHKDNGNKGQENDRVYLLAEGHGLVLFFEGKPRNRQIHLLKQIHETEHAETESQTEKKRDPRKEGAVVGLERMERESSLIRPSHNDESQNHIETDDQRDVRRIPVFEEEIR